MIRLCFWGSVYFFISSLGYASPIIQKNFVFNLTGSFRGYSDCAGSLWMLLELKELFPNNQFTAVIDDRAEKTIQDLYDESIQSLAQRLNLKFIRKNQADQISKADYLFELFFGNRRVDDVVDLPYYQPDTTVFISDGTQSSKFDEMRRRGSRIFFKPYGLGVDRSGLIDNPEARNFIGKSPIENKIKLAELFRDMALETIFKKDLFKISFLYGVTSELQKPGLLGQTRSYINELEKWSSGGMPVLVFTTNSKEMLKRVLPSYIPIFKVEEFEEFFWQDQSRFLVAAEESLKQGRQLFKIKNREILSKINVISLGEISNKKFTGLMAASDFPVLIDGVSTINLAIRLNIPFFIYKSPSNAQSIESLIQIENRYFGSTFFKDIYRPRYEGHKVQSTSPRFERFFLNPESKEIFKSLSSKVNHFSRKIALLIESIAVLDQKYNQLSYDGQDEKRSSQGLESLNKEELGHDYLQLSQYIEKVTRDEVLGYSLVWDGYLESRIPKKLLKLQRKHLYKKRISFERLQSLFVAHEFNFTQGVDLGTSHLNARKWHAQNVDNEIKRLKLELQLYSSRNILNDRNVKDYLKNHKVYVSLTTSPSRISKLAHVIETLDTKFVEEIIVNLPIRFSRDNSEYKISRFLLGHPKVKIVRTPIDWGPITKLTGGLDYVKTRDPEALLITIDDDTGYPKSMISEMIYQSVYHPNAVVAGSGRDLKFWGLKWPDNKFEFSRFLSLEKMIQPEVLFGRSFSKYVDIVEGFGAVSYPVKNVNLGLMNQLAQISPHCFASDDLVISYVLNLENIPRVQFGNNYFNMGMIRQFSYGFMKDALHSGAGLENQDNSMQNMGNVNQVKYQICLSQLLRAHPANPE